MQDRPSAQELLNALARMLFEEVLPAAPREHRFGLRVAAHTCSALAREWDADDQAVRAEAGRLVALLGQRPERQARSWAELREQVWELRREAARRLRAGELDDRWDEAVETLRASVRDKLAVAHPGYEAVSDDGRS